MKPPEPIIVVDLFPEILSGLVKLLGSLSDDDWRKPTVCAGWNVKDVALHLLGGDLGNLSRRRDSRGSTIAISDWHGLVAAINDSNELWVQAARRISPRLLIDLLQFAGSQMCDYWRSLDPYAMGGTVSWAGPDPAPIWLDLAREYTERWHHQQHIRDAVGKPGLKGVRHMHPVLAAFVRAMPRTFASTDAVEDTSVTLAIGGEAGCEWSVVRERSSWQLYEGAPGRSNARVEMDQDIAWRLFTRGITPSAAREHVSIDGDQELGSRVLEMVSIIA